MPVKKTVNDWISDPILNYVCNVFDKRVSDRVASQLMMMHAVAARHGGAREFLTQELGKQDYVWTGSVKNWVWEGRSLRDDGKRLHYRWRAFASKRGLTLEVEQGVSALEAEIAWGDFITAIGLTWKHVELTEISRSHQYNCPGCKKQVKTFRIGQSMSYLVKERNGEDFSEHECKYRGPVPVEVKL